MTIITKIFAGITALMFLMMLLCGMWLRFSSNKPTKEGIKFHGNLGIVTIIFGLVLIILIFIQKK